MELKSRQNGSEKMLTWRKIQVEKWSVLHVHGIVKVRVCDSKYINGWNTWTGVVTLKVCEAKYVAPSRGRVVGLFLAFWAFHFFFPIDFGDGVDIAIYPRDKFLPLRHPAPHPWWLNGCRGNELYAGDRWRLWTLFAAAPLQCSASSVPATS